MTSRRRASELFLRVEGEGDANVCAETSAGFKSAGTAVSTKRGRKGGGQVRAAKHVGEPIASENIPQMAHPDRGEEGDI